MLQRSVYMLDQPTSPLPREVALPAGADLRPPTPADAEALAGLMLGAHRGTIDDHGETLDQARADLRAYFEGVEGPPLLDCSWLCFVDGMLAGACLMGWWNERAVPLVYYIMIHAGWKGRGLGRALVARSLSCLAARGETQVAAVITEGNVPSERLFAGLGFVRRDSACIAAVTATVCALLGVAPPALARHGPLQAVLEEARARGVERVERCLIYAPDALGDWLYRRHTEAFAPVEQAAPLALLLRSVYPPKTPVCFASMFTGALPEDHGIRRYERPVLRVDTLFDALLRAGKRVAIVAVQGSSMEMIFRERALDYFPEPYDREVEARARELLERDEHDLIVVYQQAYDDALHRTTPESPEALQALRDHAATFGRLAEAFDRHWAGYNRALFFTPDHGGHVDPATGRGTHGEGSREDMLVRHFLGVRRAGRGAAARSPRAGGRQPAAQSSPTAASPGPGRVARG